jgi:putative NIF3 family GTP cyclohydrolase 1 type 2
MLLSELCQFLDNTLQIKSFPSDKSNNGLQVEGNREVKSVGGGVDACYELYDKAAAYQVDLIFVHHGESWGPGWKYITGTSARRLQKLFKHRMSLYAAHLPLDAHVELGHNAQIAKLLGLNNCQGLAR